MPPEITLTDLLEAMRITAQAHEGGTEADQLICNALRGVIARAGRYAHQRAAQISDDVADWEQRAREIAQEEIQNYFKGI
jgi:hypothetical protein